MTGTKTIDIKTMRYSYHLELTRKITLLRGDSGTGKTTLVTDISNAGLGDRLQIHSENELITFKPTESLSRILSTISSTDTAICIFDEDCDFLTSKEFADAVNTSGNYFLLITRKLLTWIPTGADSVVELQTDENNLHTFKKRYSGGKQAGQCKPDIIQIGELVMQSI